MKAAGQWSLVLPLLFSVAWAMIDPQDLITCLQNYSDDDSPVSGLIFTPTNPSFLPIWQSSVNNPRFNKPSTTKPSVILTPVHQTHIQTALYCTHAHGYDLRIRSGGHDFEGLSYTAAAGVPFLMIDLVNMRSIDVDVENRTAWVGGGATLGELYYAIFQKTDKLFFPAGVCPSVGVGGYLGGGGYGNLMRKYGLGSDNVVDVRFMDVNGTILDGKSMGEDLFWAIRGGGASSFGIVLAWKLRLVPVPEKVTFFVVHKTLEENATSIFHKYQYIAPNIDQNLHIRVQIVGKTTGEASKKTIRITFEGLYQGVIDTLMPIMDQNFPELGVTPETCEELTMIQSATVFGGFTASTPPATLADRSAIVNSANKGKSDYVQTPIHISGLERMWEKILENDGTELVMVNPFGGKMNEYSETATPYPHRRGILYQMLESVDLSDQSSDTTETSIRRMNWLRDFNEFIAPYVSKNPREAYLNYNDLDLGVGCESYRDASVWGERYWKRKNFKRLIGIKAKVDPQNFFRHPQSIPVFSTPLSDI